LSYYDFQRKYRHIEDKYPLERYVDDFVNGKLISASWGTWAENVGSWMATRGHTENFLLLRFEDMLEDTQRELVRIAEFLRLPVTAEALERAIVNSAADRMRQMEKQEEGQWVATKKHRKDIPFVRVAKAGGWKNNLPSPCVMQIEAAWGDLMSSLGYSLVSLSRPEERMVLDSTLSR